MPRRFFLHGFDFDLFRRVLAADPAGKAVLLSRRRDRSGISSAEAGRTKALQLFSPQVHQILQTQIAQGIHSDDLCDFLHRMLVGNEILRTVDIRTVVARRHEGRRTDPHVDLTAPA